MLTITEMSWWLRKQEEGNQEHARGQYRNPLWTDTPVCDLIEGGVIFLLMVRSTRRLVTLLHWIELIGLPSMPSIVVRRITTKTLVLKLMCPPRSVTPLRQQEVTLSGWADCNFRSVLEFVFVPRSVTPLRE